jgi:hypothetical protein
MQFMPDTLNKMAVLAERPDLAQLQHVSGALDFLLCIVAAGEYEHRCEKSRSAMTFWYISEFFSRPS